MGDNTLKSIGNFQANVGYFSADINLIITYIMAGIMIIIAIVFAVRSFIPTKPFDCNDDKINALKSDYQMNCDQFSTSQICKSSEQDYNNEVKHCNTKVKQPQLLWFLLLIPFAILIVFLARYWKKLVHRNKAAAQIGGTMFELNTLKNFMK
jgi:hypothetical protein